MKVLSVNAGSSSLKFQLFEMPSEEVLVSGVFEKIGINGSFYTIKLNGEKIKKEIDMPSHVEAVNILLKELIDLNVISKYEDIESVGHRLVHGGDVYSDSVVITDEVIKKVEELSELAPLHNPANLMGVNAFKKVLPNALMVGVFDTAFHQTMPKESYIYPVPYEWYSKYSIRKYGFHGTSHKFVSNRISEILSRDDLKVITCHLGNGGSLAAIKNGKCIDTTMGFTPLAGIPMGTRSGDIDPAIITYVMQKTGKTAEEVVLDLNKKSGFLGVSCLSSDSRDIEDGIKEGNEKCRLAQDIYNKKVVAYISEFNTLLGGADVIVFTAGLGENAVETRKEICELLSPLGVKLDSNLNCNRGKEMKISADDSSIMVYVVPTNEELMIARDTYSFSK